MGEGTAIGNTADIRQNENLNVGFIIQGVTIQTAGTAVNNTSAVQQRGNENRVIICQGSAGKSIDGGSAFNNNAEVLQVGNGNEAEILQGVDDAALRNSSAEIIQRSDNNRAISDQTRLNQSASITQN